MADLEVNRILDDVWDAWIDNMKPSQRVPAVLSIFDAFAPPKDPGTPKEWIKEWSYKPNWKFDVIIFDTGHIPVCALCIMAELDNSRRPGEKTVVAFRYDVTADVIVHGGRKEFDQFVRSSFLKAELHELDEWLRLDGELVHDPHIKERRD